MVVGFGEGGQAWRAIHGTTSCTVAGGDPSASAFRLAGMTERFHRFELAKREAIRQDSSSYGLVCFVREVAGKDYTVDGAVVCARWRAVEPEDEESIERSV